MRFIVENYPGIVIADLDRPGELRHLISADPETGEYEQWDHFPDGALRIQKDSTVKRLERKGRLMFDCRRCCSVPPGVA